MAVDPAFVHAGAPSLLAGASAVDPTNTAQTWVVLGLVIDACHPSRVRVIVGVRLSPDTV